MTGLYSHSLVELPGIEPVSGCWSLSRTATELRNDMRCDSPELTSVNTVCAQNVPSSACDDSERLRRSSSELKEMGSTRQPPNRRVRSAYDRDINSSGRRHPVCSTVFASTRAPINWMDARWCNNGIRRSSGLRVLTSTPIGAPCSLSAQGRHKDPR